MVSTPKKVLVIRFSSVGDILLSSPLLRVFRHRFPDCQIDYLVKNDYAELVRHNPNVATVIEFPQEGHFASLRELRKNVLRAGYDLIIDIHDSLRSRYITLGQRNVRRINKRKIARFLLIKTKINLYQGFRGSPGVDQRYIETVADLGVSDDGKGIEIFLPSEAVQKAKQTLSTMPARMIGIAPSAIHANKRWIPDRFSETAVALARSTAVILFGSRKDRQLCSIIEDAIRKMKPDLKVLNLAGETTLLEAAAIMDHCELIISNDSGLMHLAAARKRNLVAIFGPTVREFGFFPGSERSRVVQHPSLYCRPCTHIGLPTCPEGHFRCMNEISVSMVTQAANELL